jgi:Mor transcription activator family.
MSYIKADIILPKELLLLVQEYADGQYLYIPKKADNRRNWGECTNSRLIINRRDREIFDKYKNGASAKALADEYFLSIKSIQRIILKEKKKCSLTI